MIVHDDRDDLLVLAELNIDVVVRCGVDDVRFGQVEQLVDHAELTLGSSGAITASAAVAQGARVAVCAVVGDDRTGDLVVEMLGTHGVRTPYVAVRPGRATGMTVVLSAAQGDRALLTFPGTMADLIAADVDPDAVAGARHVHVSSIFLQRGLQPGLAALLATARRAGVTTSLDPGWDPDGAWLAVRPLLAELDYLLPNAAEARALAAAYDSSAGDTAAAARALAELGPVVVVKDGAAGALVADGPTVTRVCGPTAPVVDTTGAGDNFDAGFLVAVLDGDDPVAAARRGVASGAVAVQGWGGAGRHATRAEAVQLAGALAVEAVHGVPFDQPAAARKE